MVKESFNSESLRKPNGKMLAVTYSFPSSYFVIEFPIPISVRMGDFPTLHPHKQQSIYRLWDFTACYELSLEILYQLIEISN